MANYLRFAGAVLDEIENGLSTRRMILQLNDAQCHCLLGNLRKTHDHFSQSLLLSRSILQKCVPFYKEFYRIVEHTEAIVKECSKRDWLKAAIIQTGNRGVFTQLSWKLQFCMNEFSKTVEAVLHICSNIAFTTLNITVEHHERDEDFCQDSLKFMERLKDVVNQQVSEDTIIDPWKHQLAEYLIEREDYMSSTNLEMYTTLPQFYLAKDEYPRVGEPIGSGSAGSVLKVRWFGLECAKKHFPTDPDESDSPRKLELMKEVSALVHLDHPHVVKVLCASMEREVSFLMELMPMSLHNFIKKRWKGQEYVPFTMAAAVDIMLQIALGMEYLHGKGVVHRDLKSQNILVTPSAADGLCNEGYANIKVTDFGLSKTLTHELTEPTGILGTTCWMAPEVLRLKEGLKVKIDWRKADTYSFAMTCSEILTGAIPFCEGECTISKLYDRITKGGERPKLPLACPKFLASVLTLCWDANPALRPSFTEICYMLQLLQGYLLRGSELIHKSWSSEGTSSMDQTRALRCATRTEQDILIEVRLFSSKKLKLDTFFRSSKIFRSELKVPCCDVEVLSSIVMGNFRQPVGVRGVQVFEFNSSLDYESRKELEMRTMAKCRYFVEGMKALTDNPRNHLVKLQYWHYASFRHSQHNRLYVVYDAWSSTLHEHLHGLKKALPWNKRLCILTGFMACVVYFIELIELNVISSISLSTRSILLDNSYNLLFADVCLVHDAKYFKATNGDVLKGMVYEIGIIIMEVLCGHRHKFHLNSIIFDSFDQLKDPNWVQNLIDPRLGTGFHTCQAAILLTLGLMCANPNEDARPTIWLAWDIIASTAESPTKLTCSQPQGQLSLLHFLEYTGPSEYTCQEVRDITSNFSTPKGYGKYLGTLSNGEKVLVDQLHPSSASPKEFIDQVKMYTKLSSWGLVMNPIGFCVEEGERILIYRDVETMPAQVYLGDNAKACLFKTKHYSKVLQDASGDNVLIITNKLHSIALQIARGNLVFNPSPLNFAKSLSSAQSLFLECHPWISWTFQPVSYMRYFDSYIPRCLMKHVVVHDIGLNSLSNMDIVLHNTNFDNIHVTRNGYVMLGLQFEEENRLTKFEKLSKQMDDFGTILGQLVCGPKWQSTFATPMHLKNMAVDIKQFVDPGFYEFNNLALSQLAILASLCLEEGDARLSMVNVIHKLQAMAESWTANAGTLNLITSFETLSLEYSVHEVDATNKDFRRECLPGECELGWMWLEPKLERSGFRQVLGMRQLDRNGFQGCQEPLVQVLMQSLLYHQNLVNLIGYCADSNQLFLLYDCAPLAFLEDSLCGSAPNERQLDSESRMSIALGVARGLEYLHDKASPPVICGNLNSSNILLDHMSSPKRSVFGLTNLGPQGSKSHVHANDGCCAPECATTGEYTFESDVYSFGVVLLELITGRRAIDNARAAGEQNLVSWARPFFKNSHENFNSIVDPELLNEQAYGGLIMLGTPFILDLAARCLEQDAEARPPINYVVAQLALTQKRRYWRIIE